MSMHLNLFIPLNFLLYQLIGAQLLKKKRRLHPKKIFEKKLI